MPDDGVRAGRENRRASFVVGASVYEVDFWVPLWSAGGLVDVMSAEVRAQFQGSGDGDVREVLVAEDWFDFLVSQAGSE